MTNSSTDLHGILFAVASPVWGSCFQISFLSFIISQNKDGTCTYFVSSLIQSDLKLHLFIVVGFKLHWVLCPHWGQGRLQEVPRHCTGSGSSQDSPRVYIHRLRTSDEFQSRFSRLWKGLEVSCWEVHCNQRGSLHLFPSLVSSSLSMAGGVPELSGLLVASGSPEVVSISGKSQWHFATRKILLARAFLLVVVLLALPDPIPFYRWFHDFLE